MDILLKPSCKSEQDGSKALTSVELRENNFLTLPLKNDNFCIHVFHTRMFFGIFCAFVIIVPTEYVAKCHVEYVKMSCATGLF